jgi:hypothetical protein
MATDTSFLQAGFLHYLELLVSPKPPAVPASLTPPLAQLLLAADGSPTKAAEDLILLLKAQAATLQATADTELAADELRRYQKFAKPGQPSPHIVQLRQKQAAARRASSLSRQSLNKTAVAFVRSADIAVPPRVALEDFILGWIDTQVPKNLVSPV